MFADHARRAARVRFVGRSAVRVVRFPLAGHVARVLQPARLLLDERALPRRVRAHAAARAAAASVHAAAAARPSVGARQHVHVVRERACAPRLRGAAAPLGQHADGHTAAQSAGQQQVSARHPRRRGRFVRTTQCADGPIFAGRLMLMEKTE